MKKHPIIKYILILVISGSCGALASSIIMNFEDGVVGAINSFSDWFGSVTPALHISICLFLSLMSVYSIYKLKKLLSSITPENEDAIYDQADAGGFINLFGLPITVSAKLAGKGK